MTWISFIAVASFTILLFLLAAENEAGRVRKNGNRDSSDIWMSDEARARISRKDKEKEKAKPKRRANIVMIITDDQDVELGSLNFMPKLQRILTEGGANFNNAFVTTPMCCPSRSSMLTGMYVHNHNVYTNNDNCSSVEWQQKYETRNFGVYLTNAGYRTGYFGKYLNEYKGTHIPPGWSEWVGLIRNTRFYNYTLNFNGKKIKHADNYYRDYLTDLIANDSVTFLKQSKQYFPNRPVAMVLSMPAPHGPEDSAPQYQHLFNNVTTHRTPSWNYAPNPDKQWILQHTGKMEPIHVAFTDMLQRKRLQTLQSVDDALEKVYLELKRLGELDNTYILYTSDHGYHLGQYGLLKGKAMPYEFDIKVPFLLRGPKIPPRIRVPNMVLNLDIAPTLLDIAGVPTPSHMDGRSVLKLFENIDEKGSIIGNTLKRKKAWRDTFLVERGKITTRKLIERERIEAMQNQLVETKERRLEAECAKAEYQPPCKGQQQWYCAKNDHGRLRMYKCRYSKKQKVNDATGQRKECVCPNDTIRKQEKERQRKFLMDHVTQPEQLKPKFIRQRRDADDLGFTTDARRDVTTNTQSQASAPNNASSATVAADPLDNEELPANPFGTLELPTESYSEVDKTKTPKNETAELPSRILYKNPGDPSSREEEESVPYEGPASFPEGSDFIIDEVPRGEEHKSNSELRVMEQSQLYTGSETRSAGGVECKVLENNTVVCGREVYESFDYWKQQKSKLDQLIQAYRERLDSLKDVRKHLKNIRPQVVEEEVNRRKESKVSSWQPEGALPEPSGFSWAPSVGSGWEQSQFVTDDEDEKVTETELAVNEDCTCEEPDDADDFTLDEDVPLSLSKRERIKIERAAKKEERKKERQERRQNKRKKGRKKDKVKPVTKDCNSPNMKCFTHDNDHWRTPPVWNPLSGPTEIMTKSAKRRDPHCHLDGVECHYMDNEHWKTAPRWTMGPFCFCPNSNNNTYWCLRTINETHNFLYCEFITGFISFYDMTVDPYQLRNVIHDLNYGKLQQLHKILDKLKQCSGQRECTYRTRPADDGEQDWNGEPSESGSGDPFYSNTVFPSNSDRDNLNLHGNSGLYGASVDMSTETEANTTLLNKTTDSHIEMSGDNMEDFENQDLLTAKSDEEKKNDFLFLTNHFSLNRFPDYNITSVHSAEPRRHHRKGEKKKRGQTEI